ncbi:hypothetical protein VOLCADRAFT_96428 [Volvox carteri f. nagariensis]|uniref:Uncharacterized protein n=1 Tax=Volvox carteri f. nagariensis TaxID=3068 RepID=D8UA29_VOLCA|nr:uncharacterized protein VOLCADRAFT_96428 [Volvox carteri f. nagariensis]EFJ43401.1 hypothetical protein VOLCADRAFT_96428 [Volvox carteri f. nagariensis]|eukprot:XP_002955548.1 hypothetical protein VOLCADRAFT_96428 [Volvox carteri f. nagariensis]
MDRNQRVANSRPARPGLLLVLMALVAFALVITPLPARAENVPRYDMSAALGSRGGFGGMRGGSAGGAGSSPFLGGMMRSGMGGGGMGGGAAATALRGAFSDQVQVHDVCNAPSSPEDVAAE